MNFYRIRPDLYAEHGIDQEPDIEDGIFLTGRRFRTKLRMPLAFQVSHSADDPPKHFLEQTIPVWSTMLHQAILGAGIRNLDAYEAVLQNRKARKNWHSYLAINIIGMAACADMRKSEFDVIATLPSGVKYAKFDKLVIKASLIPKLHLFRLAQDPGCVIASERFVEALDESPPEAGWGIDTYPVRTSR
jgi:hypothetical protein